MMSPLNFRVFSHKGMLMCGSLFYRRNHAPAQNPRSLTAGGLSGDLRSSFLTRNRRALPDQIADVWLYVGTLQAMLINSIRAEEVSRPTYYGENENSAIELGWRKRVRERILNSNQVLDSGKSFHHSSARRIIMCRCVRSRLVGFTAWALPSFSVQ